MRMNLTTPLTALRQSQILTASSMNLTKSVRVRNEDIERLRYGERHSDKFKGLSSAIAVGG